MKPHRVVVVLSTVSRWLNSFKIVGINKSQLRGHTTRAASTTEVDVAGVSTFDIMKQGSYKSTFLKCF